MGRHQKAPQAAGNLRIEFKANPTQKRFIEHRPFEGFVRPADWPTNVKPQVVDLFSCRMGEGKSAALCWAVWFYTYHNPGANSMLFRDTWENMRDTTMKEFFKWFPEGVMGTFIKSEKLFEWHPRTGLKGTVTFAGMDDEKDAGKLQSREFGFVGCDEPSPAAGTGGVSELVFTTALTRLRQPGMQWYAGKLAQNNPDESHWTYKMFVDPGTDGYSHFQTHSPENLTNLPPGYYEEMMKDLGGRPDLQRRFVKGQFGFQQQGKPVCPLWSDDVHLVSDLEPVGGSELWMTWDGGLTPVCIIAQVAPNGVLMVLEALNEEDGGIYQLIEDKVVPLLQTRYAKFRGKWRHTGDPSLANRDASDSRQSPVKRIKEMIGGAWKPGPVDIESRTNPLNRRLSLLGPHGKGMIIVDKNRAKGLWYALRGGWHHTKHPSGTISATPVKNHPDSDFGDALGYLCSELFPQGQMKRRRGGVSIHPASASYAPSASAGPIVPDRTLKISRQTATRIPPEFREFD